MASRSGRRFVIEIVSDAKQFNKGMSGVQKTLTGLGVYFGGREILRGIGDTIGAARDLVESANAVEKVFGAAADRIFEFGKDSARSIGLSTEAFQSLSVVTGAVLENKGIEDFTGMTIELAERGSDMASVFNTDVSDAMNAINSLFLGQSRPIREYGVNILQADVNARALADTGKRVATELTNTDKALATYNLLMEQTADTEGDFADTSDDMANKQRILNAEYVNSQAIIGEQLLPLIVELQGAALDLLPVVTESLLPFAEALGNIGAAVGPIADVIGFLKELDTAAGGSMFLAGAFDFGADIWTKGGGAVLEAFSGGYANTYWDTFEAQNAEAWADMQETQRIAEATLKVTGRSVNEWAVAYSTGAATVLETTGISVQAWEDAYTTTAGNVEDSILGIVDVWADLTAEEQAALDVFALVKYDANAWLRELRSKWDSATGRVLAYKQAVQDAIDLMNILGGLASGQTGGGSGYAPGSPLGPRSVEPQAVNINFNGIATDPVEIGREVQNALTAYAGVRGTL